MAYPPPVPPATRTDATVMATNHPSDHNLISAALTEILNHIAVMDQSLYPIGVIAPWGGDTAPTNHLLCQGQSISRASYPELFSLWGTRFGTVDGATFNVPSMQGRSPIGYWAGGAWAATLGAALGSADSTIASHQHGDAHQHGVNLYTSYTDVDHTHGVPLPNSEGFLVSGNGGAPAGIALGQFYAISPFTSYATQANNALNHRHATNGGTDGGPTVTDFAGGSATNTNISPSIAMNFIVRAH